MEVCEIITHHIDKTQNLINVEFRLMGDDDDVVREDTIEYSFFEEFGYDETKDFNIFDTISEEVDEWEDDDFDYLTNEDDLISFLNEYYIVYPKKLPKQQFK
jgi:hypothetical protein